MGEATSPQDVNPSGGTRAASRSSKQDLRPTPDQLYLAEKLNGDGLWVIGEGRTKAGITIAALQRWNLDHGVEATTAALRTAWGFPPEGGISNPYAYVAGILRGKP